MYVAEEVFDVKSPSRDEPAILPHLGKEPLDFLAAAIRGTGLTGTALRPICLCGLIAGSVDDTFDMEDIWRAFPTSEHRCQESRAHHVAQPRRRAKEGQGDSRTASGATKAPPTPTVRQEVPNGVRYWSAVTPGGTSFWH